MCGFKCCKNPGEKAYLHPCAFGISIGLVKGIWMLGLAWVGWLSGVGTATIDFLSQFYYGYQASFLGGIYGGIAGLICGFIGGFFIAYLYNLCAQCCCKKSAPPDSTKVDKV